MVKKFKRPSQAAILPGKNGDKLHTGVMLPGHKIQEQSRKPTHRDAAEEVKRQAESSRLERDMMLDPFIEAEHQLGEISRIDEELNSEQNNEEDADEARPKNS